ncbi:uncharacterized protein LOC126971585 isoform X2 [Leptidea sinapis]|uniref:uncharacterized protein LOC126971585 isoform X2 n=1 Tax=Leptidea sinapis TaxID=189913 RepID=UPI00213A23F9|nr:uncharacterized protein LOC126971585 isoform X2 [Leptidea sinapis]
MTETKKYKIPTIQEFLEKKKIYDHKEPVWVYLEREMRENSEKKPYNEKVGAWLRFLKDLKLHYHREAQRKLKRLEKEIGPPWYCELSSDQREVLSRLKHDMYQDLLEDIPRRMRKSLADLGITLKLPKSILMKAMLDSEHDSGLFMWNLYTAYYKKPPSHLMHEQKKNTQPNVRYGEYLQKNYIQYCATHTKQFEGNKPLPLGNKVRLRSVESYEQLCNDHSFLEKRKEGNKKEKRVERVCTYKFWEPPSTLRNTDPKMIALAEKERMFKLKAKPRFRAPYPNVQYLVGGVTFSGGKPVYTISGVSIRPTGYIPINYGTCFANNGFVTHIGGFWKFPIVKKEACDKTCDCLTKWEEPVMEYIKKSKCKCGHLYDFYNEGKPKEKYVYPPTRYGPLRVDEAKIYQMDPVEDFIKDTVREALMSGDPTPTPSEPSVSPDSLKEKDLLEAFLAELSHTTLIIPHLPKANLLNNLQQWVRKRVKGNLKESEHKRLKLISERRWLDLKHMDFRAIAYRIPFTLKQLKNINWSHRNMLQKLADILMEDFETRNRLKQLTQSRLWWATTMYDAYPGKPFLDIYFTYMPGRMKDTFLNNPYSSELTPKSGAKTCPLNF